MMDRDHKEWNVLSLSGFIMDRSELLSHVLLYECYDLGMTDVWNSCKVMSKYLQICMRVGFGKSMYVC